MSLAPAHGDELPLLLLGAQDSGVQGDLVDDGSWSSAAFTSTD